MLPKLKSERYLRAGKLSAELTLAYNYARTVPGKAEELAEFLNGYADIISALTKKESKK